MAKELYVGHISENAGEEDVRKLFSVMGTVTSVHLIFDPETNEFKRCGYVRMAADVDPNEVVETLDGALLVDRVITVSIARPQKPGMSKSGNSGGFRKPGYGSKASPGAKARSGRKSGTEPQSAAEPRSGVRSKAAAGPKTGVGTTARPGPAAGRAGRDAPTERHTGEATSRPGIKTGRAGRDTKTGQRTGETAARPEPKSGRGQKPSSRPTRETERTREPKPRRP
jgi:RNA recognition motif-containing protein